MKKYDYVVSPKVAEHNLGSVSSSYHPIQYTKSPGSLLARILVARSYSRILNRARAFVKFGKTTIHDRWTLSTSLCQVYTARAVRLMSADDSFKQLSRKVVKSLGCPPAGYILKKSSLTQQSRRCRLPMCIQCHARDGWEVYNALKKGMSRRPVGSDFHVGVYVSTTENNEYLRSWSIKSHCAGGVAYRFLADEKRRNRWTYVIMAYSDSAKDLKRSRVKKVEKIENDFQLVRFISQHFRYPANWARGQIENKIKILSKAYTDYKHRCWTYRSFGASTESYTPGKSWLDFVGFSPKPG